MLLKLQPQIWAIGADGGHSRGLQRSVAARMVAQVDRMVVVGAFTSDPSYFSEYLMAVRRQITLSVAEKTHRRISDLAAQVS